MSIKGKLIVILVLIGLILAALAGVMIRSYIKTTQQVKIAGAALENLHAEIKIRSRIARQMKEVMDYVVSGKEEEKQEFIEYGAEAREALDEWIESIEEQIKFGAKGKQADMKEARDVENRYNETLKLVAKAFRLADAGKTDEAYKFIEAQMEPWMESVLFRQIDKVIRSEVEEFNEAYNEVLTRLGSMPWIVEKSKEQIKIARASTHYSLIIDRARLSIIRQMKEVLDYLISGDEEDINQFQKFGIEARRSLDEWKESIAIQMSLGSDVAENVERDIDIESKYNEALSIVGEVFNLADAGRRGEAFFLMEEKVELLVDDVLFPKITKSVEDNKKEVIGIHNKLLDFTLSAGAQGIGGLGLVSLCIFLVSVGLIRGMLISLGKIRLGTEIIGSGRLDHRINLSSDDELGQLASSFDKMTETLQQAKAELERRVAERTAQLAAANKELEAFSYSVSHDLRAPLRSIDGFSQALLDDYTDNLDAQGRDYLQRVRAASQRMAQLIDDMLNLSRITRSEMRYERIDLSSMAQAVIQELRQTQPERRLEFVVKEGMVAQGDAHLMRVVLENLLGNAWKFTTKHPHPVIEFGTSEENGKSAYYTRDNGVGFDTAYADKLFGAFQRLHKRDEFEGTGIGLATVQRIIHHHGGNVWAEGAVEKGATFYFTLD